MHHIQTDREGMDWIRVLKTENYAGLCDKAVKLRVP